MTVGDDVDASDERTVRVAAAAIAADVAALVEPAGDRARVVCRHPPGAGGADVPLDGPIAAAAAGRGASAGPAGGLLGPLLGDPAGAGDAGWVVAAPIRPDRDRAPVVVCAGRGARADPAADAEVLGALAATRGLVDELDEERRAGARAATRLMSLVEAGMSLAGELSLNELLSRLAHTARDVLGANYAALGVLNDDGTALAEFVTAGVDEAGRAAIGDLPRGRGLLGVLIRDARPLRLESISTDPRSVGFPANHPPMESFLGVPIALRDEVFGNLYITEKREGPFTAEDEQMAMTLAAQAAVAIGNARRYEGEHRRVEELESVQQVARAVLATLDLDQLLPLVARRARNLTGADTVGVALAEDEGMLVRHAHGGRALALESLALPADPPAMAGRLREELGVGAAEVAPLDVGGSVGGALVAVGDRPFDEPSRRLLDTFSSHAAIALSNARTVAEERRRLLVSAELEAARTRERAAAEGLRRAIQAQEAERARIALELHDEAGQVLSGLALHLAALDRHLDEEGRDRLADLRSLANQAASTMREIATRLRPPGLREHGLRNALERQAARVRQTGVAVDLAVEDLPAGLPEEVETAVYRVVQEALTNVQRHSGAGRASVLATGHRGRLRLVIEDDGLGFDPSAPTDRLGLAGVRERVELLGGGLRIESAPGAGTAVIVDLEVRQ